MIGTVSGLIAYAAERGTVIVDSAATAAALVRASDYIEYSYLLGSTCTAASPNVESATYEAAMLEVLTPGFWSKTFTASDQKVLTKVGQIQWTVTGDASKSGSATPRSTKIDAMLRQCIGSGFDTRSYGPFVV